MMDNIIKKLGFQWHYWYGLLTPPLVIFGFWSIEDNTLINSLSIYIEGQIFRGAFPGHLAIIILILLLGVILPVYVLSRIKCPRCKTRIVLYALNNRKSTNPFNSPSCPGCGFEP